MAIAQTSGEVTGDITDANRGRRPGTKTFRRSAPTAGVHNVYFESPGTAHEWLTWRRC